MKIRFAWVIALGCAMAGAQAADWRPDKNVEIIVWSGAGGGADRPARTLQRLFQEKKLLVVSSVVSNKPGANGTVGMVYMNQNAGDGHFISLANATLVTNRITGVSPLSYKIGRAHV